MTKRSSSGTSANRNSLASRIGNNGPSPLSQSTAAKAQRNATRAANLAAKAQDQIQNQIQSSTTPTEPSGISIRGAAGPYIVVAQNFAPGTTAADIESVMQPIGGDMASCRLTASVPTVIAEMAFLDKSGAESVIATFNNKKADGRLLYVYMKEGGSTTKAQTATSRGPRVRAEQHVPQAQLPQAQTPQVQIPEAQPQPQVQPQPQTQEPDDVIMDMDDVTTSAFRDERTRHEYARSARDERGYNGGGHNHQFRHAEPAWRDSRYGSGGGPPSGPRWGERDDRQRGYAGRGQGRMYSDSMLIQQGGRRYRS